MKISSRGFLNGFSPSSLKCNQTHTKAHDKGPYAPQAAIHAGTNYTPAANNFDIKIAVHDKIATPEKGNGTSPNSRSSLSSLYSDTTGGSGNVS